MAGRPLALCLALALAAPAAAQDPPPAVQPIDGPVPLPAPLALGQQHWIGVNLSAENFKQCYVPQGFAHGFCVVTPVAQVEYKCTDLYDSVGEIGIAWNDPDLAIGWPVRDPILSARDQQNPTLAAVMDRLPKL